LPDDGPLYRGDIGDLADGDTGGVI